MNKKIIGIIVAVLVVIAGVFAINMTSPDKDGITVIVGDKETVVAWEDIACNDFSGELVNGKGEVFSNDYEGIELAEFLEANGFELDGVSEIVVTSEDNYTASLTAAELLQSGKVYIALSANGETLKGIEGGQGAQLIVFGDPNSKRAVRYMKVIELK